MGRMLSERFGNDDENQPTHLVRQVTRHKFGLWVSRIKRLESAIGETSQITGNSERRPPVRRRKPSMTALDNGEEGWE